MKENDDSFIKMGCPKMRLCKRSGERQQDIQDPPNRKETAAASPGRPMDVAGLTSVFSRKLVQFIHFPISSLNAVCLMAINSAFRKNA